MLTRRERKLEARKGSWVQRVVVCGLLFVGVAALVVGILPAASLPPSEVKTIESVKPARVKPTPTAQPTETPTPTPTPTPEPAPWVWAGAHLTIPAAEVDGEVTPYGRAELNPNGDVEPAGKWTISWYSGFYEEGIPSIPSASAEEALYIFCHTYGFEPAACNKMPGLQPGAEAILANGNGERITYVMESSFTIHRDDFRSDERVYSPTPRPDTLVMVTCDGTGPRDADGRTLYRIVTIFMQVSVEKTV